MPAVQRWRRLSADDILAKVKFLRSSSADLPDIPRRAEPLYDPPHRRHTPPGFPRWPGENETSARSDGLRRPLSNWPLLMQWLRAHTRICEAQDWQQQHLLREIARNRSRPSGERHWRPPRSAHSTHRFADLSSHPFASASPGHVALTQSQRSLRYASENHVPVTPARAQARLAQRSAPLPSNLYSSSSSGRSLRTLASHGTVQQGNEIPAQSTPKLCKHQLTKLKNTQAISAPVLLAHHGQSVSSLDGSLDGTSPEIGLHEIPPIAIRDHAPLHVPSTASDSRPVLQLQSDSDEPPSPTTRILGSSPNEADDATFDVHPDHPVPGITHATTFSTDVSCDTMTDPQGRA